MTRRVLLDAVPLLGALVVSVLVTDAAGARGPELAAGSVNVDLNVAALVVALGTLITGVIAYLRLRSERPKIVQEVGKLAEDRLRGALESSWQEVDRCRARIATLEERDSRRAERESWLETRVDVLERALRAAGVEVPPVPPAPA